MGSILSAILGGASHFLGGGVLGIVGSLGGEVINYFKKKKEIEQQVAVINAQKELALAKANGDLLLETTKMQNAATTASYEHDTKAFGKDISWLDTYRGSLRPNMCYLMFFTAAGITVYSITKVGLDTAVMSECAKYGVYTCMDLATMIITWYFGNRQMDKIQRRK